MKIVPFSNARRGGLRARKSRLVLGGFFAGLRFQISSYRKRSTMIVRFGLLISMR